jgi:glutamate synthase (NADPH/NADH) small chain
MDMLCADYDAVVLSGGAEAPRDLPVAGRELDGIHFAMDFLTQQNKRVAGDPESRAAPNGTLSAKGKHVVVIGGGDTGSDCIGTSNRHGAASVTQFEIMPQPPAKENKPLVWPDWPLKMRTSSSHQEGCERDWSVQTKRAIGDLNDGKGGKITALECVRVDWQLGNGGQMKLVEVPGSEFTIKADLVLLAMGFVGPKKAGLVEQSGVELDARGNVKAPLTNYQTSKSKIFSCGDMRRGQSLVVWAIREGRQCARGVDEFLMGSSELPR